MNACSRRPSRRVFPWGTLAAALAIAAVLDVEVGHPAEPPATTTRYRRIYVPADNIAAWPRGGQKYLPVDFHDFEAWLRAANSSAYRASAATVQDAQYSARLEVGRLVDCRGRWTIAVHGEGRAFLPLGETSLIVRDAAWENDPRRAVRIGAWGKNDSSAEMFALEVPKTDNLEFSWNAPATAIHNGVEISWQPPVAATAARVILDMPEGKIPELQGGALLEKRLLPGVGKPAKPRFHRWTFGLNSTSATALRIVDAAGGDASRHLSDDNEKTAAAEPLTVHDKSKYRITERGIEIDATWRFDQAVHDRRGLTMTLPEDVRLISATIDKRQLSWRIAQHDPSGGEIIAIELPDHEAGQPVEITLRAWKPLLLDRVWQLPLLRPDEVFWLSGSVEISIAPQLELLAFDCKDCVQTGAGLADDGQIQPEVSRLTMYSPGAMVNLRIARRLPRATIRLGSSLALVDADIRGRLVAEWNVRQGSLFKLAGELAPGWVVESVETIPAEALGGWFIDQQRSRRRIEVQLARAARPGRSISVAITGRLRRAGFAEPIQVKTIRMVDWRDGHVAQHLLTFQTAEPFAVETLGKLPAVPAEALSEAEKSRLSLTTGKEAIFDLAPAGDDASFKLAIERGKFAAELQVDAVCVSQEVSARYQWVIHPAANGVDRLLVYSTAEMGDVQWTAKNLAAPLAAERLPADHPRRARLPRSGELWSVRLPELTTGTFELAASFTASSVAAGRERGASAKMPARIQLPLLALPDAAHQRGQVRVYADSSSMPWFDTQGLQRVPPSAPSAALAEMRPLRAAYRYDPARCLDSAAAPRMSIDAGPTDHVQPLIATQIELESVVRANGWVSHCATYDLQNDGSADFRLRLPEGAVVRALLLNGQTIDKAVDSSGRLAAVPLGAAARSAIVSVHFDVQQRRFSAASQLEPPLVHGELPILGGRWTIWLPSGLSASAQSEVHGESWDGRRRLFGLLSRPALEALFDPLRTSDWLRLSPLGSLSTRSADVKSDRLGWAAYRLSFVANVPGPVWLVKQSAIEAWAITVFLTCLVVGGWIVRRGARKFVTLLAATAALALVLPVVFAPLATAGFLGLLCSPLRKWLPQISYANANSRAWSRLSTVSASSLVIALLAAKPGFSEPAGTPQAPADGDPRTIERVLIPVDSGGRVAGSKYYISESLLRRLMRPPGAREGDSRQWVLRGARYHGELRERAEPPGIFAGDWSLVFDIETFARDTMIVLPLMHHEAAWQDTAMLDGVPLPLIWREGGRGCAVDISEPGQYSLALSCVPAIVSDSRSESVGLSVPPLAGTKLSLRYPESLKGLTVSNAPFAPPPAESSGRLERELSLSGRLELRWPAVFTIPAGPQALRVTSLRWLRIGPEDVGLQLKYVIEGSGRRPESLVVAFDRRWQLLKDQGDVAGADVGAEPDGRRSVRVTLPPAKGDRQEMVLHWRLQGAEALGRLRLPPIELLSIPVTERWLAISTVADLECEIVDASATAGAANEFLAMWGRADDTPQLVLGNISKSVPWSLAVRPRKNESLIEEVLHIAAGRTVRGGRLRVVYHADVTPGPANEFQVQLIVPAAMSIDGIAVSDRRRESALRWARVDETHVNIFFRERMDSAYRVQLKGTVPAPVGAVVSLPRVTAITTSSTLQTVQLYREEDVVVETSGLSDTEPLPRELGEPSPPAWMVRLVGAYRLDQSASDRVGLKIGPQVVQLSGSTLVSLTRDADTWSAGFSGRLTVEKGQLDTLKLRAPASWSGPFAIESDVPAALQLESADQQGASGTSLLIRFDEPIDTGKSIDLRVSGPLVQPAQSPVSTPEITPEPAVDGKRFLLVPSTIDGQPIAWNETGVRPAELPKDLRAAGRSGAGAKALQVVDSQFSVTVRPSTTSRPPAQARLVDTTIWEGATGCRLIETRWVLSMPASSEGILQLPRDQELVSVHLDEGPATIQPLDAGRWRISLGPDPLPQMLEIRSLVRAAEDRRKIRRPLLFVGRRPIPVEFSVWSIGQLFPTARPRIVGAATVTEAEQAAFRLERLVSIAEAVMPAAVELPQPDGYHWFRAWADRLLVLRQPAEENRRTVTARSVSQVSPSAEELLTRAAERVDRWILQGNELLADGGLAKVSMSAAERAGAGQAVALHPGRWIYCLAAGDASELIVDSGPLALSRRQLRILGLLAVCGTLAATLWLMGRPAAIDLLYRWPQAIAFLIGVLYWSWLRPSWLGLLIAAASFVLAWWTGWPGRSLPKDRSTVLRLPRGDVVAP
jgi:hypothetical protein